MSRHFRNTLIIWSIAASIAPAGRAAGQTLSGEVVALATAHALLSDGLYGFGARMRIPLGGRASMHVGAEHVTGTARRPGILCVGLVMPGTCRSAEPVRDDARLTAAVGGLDIRVAGTARRNLSVSADVRLGWVHAESHGATTGRGLSDEKSLIGGELGLQAMWSLTADSPFALEVGGSLGEMRPVLKEELIDGYNPFLTDFKVARLRVGVRWLVPERRKAARVKGERECAFHYSSSMRPTIIRSIAACLLAGCASTQTAATPDVTTRAMNQIAESYVKLALMAGVHDPDFVDAYYGPPEWKKALETQRFTRESVRDRAAQLRLALSAIGTAGLDSTSLLRRTYLDKQLLAMETRLDIVMGKRLTFDEESRLLYDAVAPKYSEAYYQNALLALDRALPGSGPVAARYETFRSQFVIPRARLDTVFRAAIAECRTRTARHVTLPPGESFTVEYVSDKPWSGYNWYQGGYRSVIQVNTDLPIFIDRAVDLACHEGYPGHHVFNALLEQHLTRERGWVEFSVYALFSPQSLIAEGSANFGIDMAFPGAERAAWEREHLFALAGLDPSRAEAFYRVQALAGALRYAGNEAARRYLDGEIDAVAAAQWLTTYGLMEPARARQRVAFIDKYRSYVINYNLGADLVQTYVERLGGTDEARRWRVFGELLSSPRLPSGLR